MRRRERHRSLQVVLHRSRALRVPVRARGRRFRASETTHSRPADNPLARHRVLRPAPAVPVRVKAHSDRLPDRVDLVRRVADVRARVARAPAVHVRRATVVLRAAAQPDLVRTRP